MASTFTDNEDLAFYFDRGIDWDRLVELTELGGRSADGYADVREAVAAYRDVAALVGELAAEEIAPRAARIDRERAELQGGEVVEGAAMREVMDKIRQLDLHRLCLPRELGGLNAPLLLYFITGELIARADVSTMTHHSFHGGIAMALLAYSLSEGTTHADAAAGKITATRFAKEIEEIASGRAWGSMDITEPDAGSDMAALRCSAVEEAAGDWRVSGQKIFISSGHGKHHLLIARTEPLSERAEARKDATLERGAAERAGAPSRSKRAIQESTADPFGGLAGLSMFLVTAYEDRPDGTRVRHATIDRIEEKLGHHGSVTTALSFERAPARLIGKRGEGFKYMLLLMNNARLAVGFEALGLCEAAHRLAAAYAEQRRSMGKPLARHEMIADYLDEMRTDIQGLRALAMHAAVHEEAQRKLTVMAQFAGAARPRELAELGRVRDHQARARRATPLLKYLAGEKAVELARRCMQIHGGVGYTQDFGAEKLLRDALVLPVYEGTSQIQALMAMKDTLSGILKRPQDFVARRAQARWKSLRGRDELERRVARLQDLSLSAQWFLVSRTAASKLRTLVDVPVGDWATSLTRGWDPKRDFALAMLHAERLTRLLADELIAEVLLDQARRFGDRREVLERWLERAEPRSRMLHEEITTTGGRLLSLLAGEQQSLRGVA